MNAQSISGQQGLSQGDGVTHASLDELLGLRHEAARLRSGRQARAARAGAHLSHMHARGVDYAESRIYQPGDDIRVMDWRVTARTGRPHTKLFLEERERDLLLILDMNPGMRFGTRARYKSVQALRCAALAAWMTTAAGDRVGALAFGGTSGWARPRGGTRGVLALLGEWLRWDVESEPRREPLSAGLERALHRLHGGSRVLLLSDGFSCDDQAQARLMRVRGKADAMVLGIADALEMQVPAVDALTVENDGRRTRLAFGSGAGRERFRAAMGRGRRQLDALCAQCGVPSAWLETSSDPGTALRGLLMQSVAGRRR